MSNQRFINAFLDERVYRLHRHNKSYFIVIPKPLVLAKMVENGVKMCVLSYNDNELVIRLVVASGTDGKYIQDNKESGKNAHESGTAGGD
jgi:hypothetical protein